MTTADPFSSERQRRGRRLGDRHLLPRQPRAGSVGAWPIVVERLRAAYGAKLVDAAVHRYMRELRQENKSLKRQVRHARAAWIKRTGL